MENSVLIRSQLHCKIYTLRFLKHEKRREYVPYGRCYIETYKAPPHLKTNWFLLLLEAAIYKCPVKLRVTMFPHFPQSLILGP
jgi:hypothetical protein